MNIGIVGLGGAGRAHIRRFRRNPAVTEIFGYDPKYPHSGVDGVQLLPSLDALLKEVDAVSICTPDHQHYSDICDCLQAKVHVLVEKPMVASLEDALKLADVLKKSPGLVFGVHHQMRHTPAFRRAYELIRDGTLGQVFYIESNYWHDMKPRNAMYDDWRITDGQSLIYGHACHTFDLIMNLVGSAPTDHHTLLSGPDTRHGYTSATTIFSFGPGVTAKSHVNSDCVYPQLNDLVVLGSKASYVDGVLYRSGKFTQESDFFGAGDRRLGLNVVSIRIPQRLIAFCFKSYLAVFNWISNRLMSNPDFGFRRFPLTAYNHDSACQAIVDNFVDSVRGDAAVFVGYEDAVRVIELCERAEQDGLQRRSTPGAVA